MAKTINLLWLITIMKSCCTQRVRSYINEFNAVEIIKLLLFFSAGNMLTLTQTQFACNNLFSLFILNYGLHFYSSSPCFHNHNETREKEILLLLIIIIIIIFWTPSGFVLDENEQCKYIKACFVDFFKVLNVVTLICFSEYKVQRLQV